MCGIIGYVGERPVQEVLLQGLEKLEYRGYDSAGIFTLNKEGKGTLTRVEGRISSLKRVVKPQEALSGIGHTRWATHGAPSVENAHPHISSNQRFALVHNGVVENVDEIKAHYFPHFPFKSQTDTEVLVELLALLVDQNKTVLEALIALRKLVKGSYALVLTDNHEPGKLYGTKEKSPLLIGKGLKENFAVSDALAALTYTKKFLELKDGESFVLDQNQIELIDLNGRKVERLPYELNTEVQELDKGPYPFYMAKEMAEQPAGLRKIMQAYDKNGELGVSDELLTQIKKADRLYFVGAGTSYHAALVGRKFFEKWCKLPTEVLLASEAAYDGPIWSEKPFFIFLSQSGETADSRQVMQKIKALGYPNVTITNVQGSTLSREADFTLLLHEGPEIAVASTKAYTGQIAVLSVLAYTLAKEKNPTFNFNLRSELSKVAEAMEEVLDQQEKIKEVAKEWFENKQRAFYIGRSLDYATALEAALKLKEISYIQTEGFASGELKHGTISLIEEGTPVVGLITQKAVADLTRSNLQEVQSRGAKIMTIAMENLSSPEDTIILKNVSELLAPLVTVVVGQRLAYETTLLKGLDVDKPRHLAKAVTVE